MPRSSRHKSSKHSSRDAREHSDSERDSALKEKEKRTKEESSGRAGEKRKESSKDLWSSENGDNVEEYSSSKRRKNKDDGVSNRWNGENDDIGEKKSKAAGESKSKRREEVDGEDTKRNKSEGKHREREREKKGRDGKGERLVGIEEHSTVKQSTEKFELEQPEIPKSDSQLRKLRYGSSDGDKNQENNGDILDKQMSLRNDTSKDRAKEEKQRDERYRDKYRDEMHREDKYRYDKLRDERPAKVHASKSSEKHFKDEKDSAGVRQKKSKAQDSDRHHDQDIEYDPERERDCDYDSGHDQDHDSYQEQDHYHDYDRECDYDHEWDNDRDHERDRDMDRDRDRDHRDDHDGMHLDERSARYKVSRGRKRSPDDRDDGNDIKSRSTKANYLHKESKSLASGRADLDFDRGRSHSRQANIDVTVGSSSKRRTSPSPSSHVGTEEYRHSKQEDSKYRDPVTEQRSKATSSRELNSFSGTSERDTKYRSMEKSGRGDECHSGEFPIERSSSSKASPKGMMESPSSTSVERRYMNRGGIWRNLDSEERGWRSSASIGGRELSVAEDRLIPLEKPIFDESSQGDSAFYNKAGQGNSSIIPQPLGFRAGMGSPSFMGSMEEDNRVSISGRYKRNGDLNVGREEPSGWRGGLNWPSPVPNGFIPFQHGPPHGGFQAMMPQFPSPSLFGVRPSMEINHAGIPYHIPDADRFPNHLRPIGWQNMMDRSGPAQLHGWDGNNVVFRDDDHMYGGPEWNQNRHPLNGRFWDTGSDVWKEQNRDIDLPSVSQQEDQLVQAPLDYVYDGQEGQKSQHENRHSGGQVTNLEKRSDVMFPAKESSRSCTEIIFAEAPDSSKKPSDNDGTHYCQVYLSKLDISTELVSSELYDQYVSLLNEERSQDLFKDVTMLVNLKNGGRAVQKATIAVLSPSLIPATNPSVFQKAMDLYKKQRLQLGAMPNVNGGMLAFILASNQEKGKKRTSNDAVEPEEPVVVSDVEMLDAATVDSDQQRGEPVETATAEEYMEQQPVSNQTGELPDHVDSLSQKKSELANTDIVQRSPEVPKPVSNGNEAEEMESKLMISGDAVKDSTGTHDGASDSVTLSNNGENLNGINKTEGDNSVCRANERQVFDDAISGSLFFSDEPKVSGDLITGSNESESLILKRIHHSPENTH